MGEDVRHHLGVAGGLVYRQGNAGGLGLQQSLRALVGIVEGDIEGGNLGGICHLGQGLIGEVPPLGQSGPLGGELLHGLPAQGVEGGAGQGQTCFHLHLGLLHPVGGASGLGQLGRHIRLLQGTGAGGLRGGPGDGDGVAVLVGESEGGGGVRLNGGGQGHGNELGGLIIPRPGGGKQFLGFRLLLPHAEHVGTLVPHKVPVGEALAGEGGGELGHLFRGGLPALPQGVGIHLGDHPYIFWPLHPALDFGAGHPHVLELVQVSGQGHVLEGQGVAVCLALPAVAQAAGLGAQTTVAAAATQHRGEETLSRVAHAQRSVDKGLNLNGGVGADVGDLLGGQLPGQHRPGEAQIRTAFHAIQVVNGHLGGGVEVHIGGHLTHHLEKAHVLHQNGVHAQTGGLHRHLGGLSHFPVGGQGVEGEVHLHPVEVAQVNGLLQLLPVEVAGVAAGVEGAVAQIHGIRPGVDRRTDGLGTAGRG